MTSRRIVLGTLPLATVPRSSAESVIETFLDKGGSWIDTAARYGDGEVERTVGACLARASAPTTMVATKVGHFPRMADYRRPGSVRQAVEQCCERLGRVPDLVALHEADWAVWWCEGAEPWRLLDPGDTVDAMLAWEELIETADLLGCEVGVTGNNAGPLERVARETSCPSVLVAKQHDLVWRSCDRLLQWRADDTQRRLWLGAPFHQGALMNLRGAATSWAIGDVALARAASAVADVLEDAQVPVEAAAIAFALDDPRVDAVAVGVRSVKELTAALDAIMWNLPEEVRRQLLAIGLERAPLPGTAWGKEWQ